MTLDAGSVAPRQVEPDGRLHARSARRARLVVSSAALATVAVVVGVLLASQGPSGSGAVEPVPPRRLVTPAVPVWYDADGLHRGAEVYDVPVDLPGGESAAAALALVGNGALYLDPGSGDVWFQPWQGRARVVGQGSRYGPAADPDGTTAAWFEGDELVVFDTAQAEEIARTAAARPVSAGSEHLVGNAFRYVDADGVVWAAGSELFRFDRATGTVDEFWSPGGGSVTQLVRDVHEGWLAWADSAGEGARVTRLSGEPLASFAEPETFPVFSPDGRYVLAAAQAGRRAVVGAVPTGEVWFASEDDAYPWLGWSYGNVAMVLQDRDGGRDTLLACDVEAQQCSSLTHRGRVLLPTS